MAFRVVTDSTCDLPEDVVRDLGITVVPCMVQFGNRTYADGVDIEAAEFYDRLAHEKVEPKTSQPPVGAFVDAYRRLAKETDEIVSLHISSKLSATTHSARLARDEVKGGPRIEVIDSLQVSLGLGILVMELARLSRQGGCMADAVEFLDREIPHITSYCTVDTLEYLVRGGRASKIQGFLGSLLDIKPIITVKDNGEVHPVGRVRSRKRSIEKLAEIVCSQKGLKAVGVLHSASRGDAEAIAAACASSFPPERIILSQFSAVMGAHLGPRALGLGLWAAS